MQIVEMKPKVPDALRKCAEFHGHVCPGLVYGYRVAREALRLMKIRHSADEEVVAACENDSCAVDALQVLLGTTAGKGNLMIKDWGKNAYTVLSRSRQEAYRFSRRTDYRYKGKDKKKFDRLDAAVNSGTASAEDWKTLKILKINDLLARPFGDIFTTEKVPFSAPRYAPLAPSVACAVCREMTMASKMRKTNDGRKVCIPCARKLRQFQKKMIYESKK